MPMNSQQARVVDPVLSKVALDYATPGFTGKVLFPMVECPKRGGKVIKFDKSKHVDIKEATRRAPGAQIASMQYGYASEPIALWDDKLNGKVPKEWIDETDAMPGKSHGIRATHNVMYQLDLILEIQQAELAMNPANYEPENQVTLAPGSKFIDPDVDPKKVFDAGKEAIRRKCGIDGNVAHFSPEDWLAFCNNNVVKSQFKYTNADSITEAMAARYLQLDTVVVGKSVYAASHDSSEMADVWAGGTVLAFVPQGESAFIDNPSYGYTYNRKGHPVVEQAWFDKSCDAWLYPTETSRRPYLTSMQAGFLIMGAS
ncbi:hypothetical protein QF117_10615 [Vibrio sp. YMD68]|uniref:hypothetical protein n=1 Tax=Vibrio sp. YMD68 TaxID=3042300 RepID=UPI00249AE432|nr:hypothetical protein [Vibrio sp. YMD68]WGV98831.1 hypothetical protein QF117_02395 [Vibrio sp. YMD68]WGW01242.1 hypothetical protein QF117_10615 [Vibrio sp. YMD68]